MARLIDTSSLNQRAREAIPYIQGAVRGGLGPQATYNALRELGMAPRKQTTLDIYRTISYAYNSSSLYIPDDGNLKPDALLIPLSPYNQSKRYLTTVNVSYYDPTTYDVFEQSISLTSDYLRPVNEYIEQAMEALNTYGYGYEIDLGESYIESIFYSDNPRLV